MINTKRIEKIESELGRVKKINNCLVAMMIGALAIITLGAATDQEKPAEIRAKKFILEDNSGNERGVFSVGEKGVGMELIGTEGKPQVTLYADDSGQGLYLSDVNGKERIGLWAKGKDVQVAVSDSSEKQRLEMAIRNDQPEIILSDANGTKRIMMKIEETNSLLTLSDINGKLRIKLGMMRDNFPNLTLSGAGGEPFWAAIPDGYQEK